MYKLTLTAVPQLIYDSKSSMENRKDTLQTGKNGLLFLLLSRVEDVPVKKVIFTTLKRSHGGEIFMSQHFFNKAQVIIDTKFQARALKLG